MKKFISLLALVAFAVASQAADTKPVETAFQRYWSVYAKKDFAKAAAEVLPSDLEATKAAVLPVVSNKAVKKRPNLSQQRLKRKSPRLRRLTSTLS